MNTAIHLAAFQEKTTSQPLVTVADDVEYVQDCVMAANEYYLSVIKTTGDGSSHAVVQHRRQ